MTLLASFVLTRSNSAGSRDSELTNHGVQQATRLGQHFATTAVQLTHVFSSQLKRAVKTAELVRAAQPVAKDDNGGDMKPVVAQVKELAEQDFGSLEGVSFMARQPGSKVSGKDTHRTLHKDDPDFVDVESKDSMIRRVDVFLDEHLLPIVQSTATTSLCVAVVSHGITLSYLWRRLLHRMPARSVTVHPEVASKYSGIDLERIGGWSNTGYLELDISYTAVVTAATSQTTPVSIVPGNTPPKDDLKNVKVPISPPPLQSASEASVIEASPKTDTVPKAAATPANNTFVGWTIAVCAVNSKQHLVGLKRTGGGVGSSRHDDKQKTIETFFKRRKLE